MPEPHKARGTCPVCYWRGALRKDGTLYRHWAGFEDADRRPYWAIVCQGWKRKPLEATHG